MTNPIEEKIKVGITQGDINGIGMEVIIKTLLDNKIVELCTPIVYGSPKVVAYHRKALNIPNFSLNNIKGPEEANPKRANIINVLDDNVRVELGKSTQMAGESSFLALEKAVADLRDGKIDVLVTAPINKHNIFSENFKFTGHTEYITSICNPQGSSLMLMVGHQLKIGVLTNHVPVNQIAALVTEERIMEKLRIMNQTLLEDFGIAKPTIAVLGLNPHAGDNGLIGSEEQNIIIPALEKARKENIMALGPFSADGLFGSGNFSKFDAILAMYHDQGLIPFKALVFDEGINFSAGLPVIRTSPAHGTAYEIAGENKASETSFRSALYLAIDIYHNRKQYKEIVKNQLKQEDIQELLDKVGE